MADASENRWGECPSCFEVNSQRAICCSKCGARLPWAEATSAAKPSVKTSAAASSAAFAKGAGGSQNKSQAELEAIMNGAQSTLQEKGEAWKPVGTKDAPPQGRKKRMEADVSDWKREFDFWETVADARVKAVIGVLLLLFVGTVLRATILKPAPAYRVAAAVEPDNPGGLPSTPFVSDPITAGNASAPAAPAPSASGAVQAGSVAPQNTRIVTYHVEGTAGQTEIKFANGSGFDTRNPSTLPWKISCGIRSGNKLSVVARIKGSGSITVFIDVDGQVISQKSGQGANQVVECQAMA